MINKPYDCREDVMKHKEMVEYWLNGFATRLKHRAYTHDNSKLKEPEEIHVRRMDTQSKAGRVWQR